jgi:sulfotransferase family protein
MALQAMNNLASTEPPSRRVAAPTRIAMWSGPRNISTALMRAWENRGDCLVVDEPLYAHYLTQVEVGHPGVTEVIAHHDADWRRVVAGLVEGDTGGRAVHYQKHMAHHFLPHLRGDWVLRLSNCFLIRHPAEMLTSLRARMGQPALRDTGLAQQAEIFRLVRDHTGAVPPVIDAEDVLRNPGAVLARLCTAVGVSYTDRMLHWPAGRRETDGIWARYWYEAVERSTGFEPYSPRPRQVSPELEDLLAECLPFYEELHRERITAN